MVGHFDFIAVFGAVLRLICDRFQKDHDAISKSTLLQDFLLNSTNTIIKLHPRDSQILTSRSYANGFTAIQAKLVKFQAKLFEIQGK